MQTQTGLSWNTRGHIRCDRHAPAVGSYEWCEYEWQAVTERELRDMHMAGCKVGCDTCALEARNGGAE